VVLFDRGSFEFTVYNIMADGTRFFDVLLDEVSATTLLKVTLDVTSRGRSGVSARSFTDTFYFTTQDMSLSKDGFEVRVKSNGRFDSLSTSVDAFINSGTPITYRESATNYDALVSGDFISDVLDIINPTATNYIASANFGAQNSSIIDNQFVYCLVGRASGGSAIAGADIQTIQSAFFQLASVDGAVIGTGLGYSYYSTRSSTPISTLSTSDIVKDSLTRINKRNQYRGISINYKNTSISLPNWDYESESAITPTVTSNTSAGSYTIALTGAGIGDVLEGDIIYFGDSSSVGDNRQVYECKSQDASNLVLTKPLATDISAGDKIFKLNTYNYGATKVVALYYETKTLFQAQYDLSNTRYDSVGSGSFSNPTNTGLQAYEGAYGAEGQARLILVVDGIDKVEPYDAITLDSTFSDKIAGNYIVARWKADYEKDTIELELHEP